MFDANGIDQIANVIRTLRARPDSRRGVVQIFEASDLAVPHKEVPCTTFLQFLVRDKKLHMIASMRSNDVHSGLVHDLFSFTMIQEIVARSVGVDLGWYKHVVGSLHLYDDDADLANDFLKEGWQTTTSMPEMPPGDPWPAIKILLTAENEIRSTGALLGVDLSELDPYWADLIRLLLVLSHNKRCDRKALALVRKEICSEVYHQCVDSLALRQKRQRGVSPVIAP